MRKLLVRILAAFILNKQKRKEFRKKYTTSYLYFSLFKQYKIKGKNNRIVVIENGKERLLKWYEKIKGFDIQINGDSNLIKLELPIISDNTNIIIKNHNVVINIGMSDYFHNVNIICQKGNNQVCKIGNGTTIAGASVFLDEESSLIIGKDCMLSSEITIWPIDGHAIVDKNTKQILNAANKPIVIGNHVWIGHGTRITKNAQIGNNCIIGGGSVVCKDYKEDNVIIAGNPGKIIKWNVNWDRRNPYYLKLEQNDGVK